MKVWDWKGLEFHTDNLCEDRVPLEIKFLLVGQGFHNVLLQNIWDFTLIKQLLVLHNLFSVLIFV